MPAHDAMAGTAGHADLHLRIGQARRDPSACDGRRTVFALDLPCGDLHLVSRIGRPQSLGLAMDGRLLGYALTRLALVQGDRRRAIPLDHPALFEGFHPPEPALRWTDGAARLPAALFDAVHGPAELHVDGFGLARYAAMPAETALYHRFASLGDDCELGMVQHAVDAEPQDLFRWGSTDLARLVLGLCQRFAGLGDPAATRLQWHADLAEYRLHDARYATLHTWHTARIDDPARAEEMRLASCARLRLLRRKLLAEIETGRRIFVFKSASAGTDGFHALHAALRGIGPAPLLCVAPATRPAQVGRVDALGGGLYLGHIDRFDRDNLSHAIWRDLCAATAALVDAE